MQKTEQSRSAKTNQRKVRSSTTLSRKYTRRPAKNNDTMVTVKRSPKVKRFASPEIVAPVAMQEEPMVMATPHPMQESANTKMRERANMAQPLQTERVSAKELKDQAIKKALASASNVTEEGKTMSSNKSKAKKKTTSQLHFGFGRVLLALSCAAAAVFAIVYFVNLNMPDISMRVAAMQTGMDPSYPNYVPRDYSISSITSEDGKITMEFFNSNENSGFTLIEEKSSWDTNALLSNYVKEEYGESYSIIREQGLTIYISGSDAAWVNGGKVYKINTTSGTLTNKQIRSIATSL